MNSQYILFDLDGTLTDPAEGITNAIAYALQKFNIEIKDKTTLYPYIGPPLTTSFRQFHGLSHDDSLKALQYYREYFREKGMFENIPYTGIEEMLQNLRKQGFNLMIATSKPEEFTVEILRHFHLDNYFLFVAGNTLDESRPTKGEVIAYLKQQYPMISSENAVMIGDRKYDIEGAKENALPSIGVLYGYGTREELQQAGADAIAHDIQDLYYQILHVFGGLEN